MKSFYPSYSDVLSNMDNDSLWEEILSFHNSGNDKKTIELSENLSHFGDWRGSYMLGYIYEDIAKKFSEKMPEEIDRIGFKRAAKWYKKSIDQGAGCSAHTALASYYYYGLGGQYDFQQAYRYLKYCIDDVDLNIVQCNKTKINILQTYIMLGELLFMGYGVKQDISQAKKYLLLAADAGFPAAYLGLSRIEKAGNYYIKSYLYYIVGYSKAIKLSLDKDNQQMLSGIGGKFRVFRRDGIPYEVTK